MTKNVGLGFAQLARLAASDGHVDEAIGHAVAQQELCQAYVDTLPADVIDPVHKDLVDAGLHVATLMMQAGQTSQAEAALEQAERTARFLYETQPGVFDNAYLISWVHWMHGEIARSQGTVGTALAHYREIVTLLEPWKEKPACREMATVLISNAEGVMEHLRGATEHVAQDML